MITRERVKYNLEDAFFSVSEEPISWGEFMGQSTRIQGYKAIVDKETGVQYLLAHWTNVGGLTVLVDKDGKPLLDPRYAK